MVTMMKSQSFFPLHMITSFTVGTYMYAFQDVLTLKSVSKTSEHH